MNDKIKLNSKQIRFIMDMHEIDDADKAIDRFMTVMLEEHFDPYDMSPLIDELMARWNKKPKGKK